MSIRKVINYVATTVGPLNVHRWQSLVKYFSVFIGLTHTSGIFTPDRSNAVSSPLTREIIRDHTDWRNPKYTPTVGLSKSSGLFSPDRTKSVTPTADRELVEQSWPTACQLYANTVFTDQLPSQKTGLIRDQKTTLYGHLDAQQVSESSGQASCEQLTSSQTGFSSSMSIGDMTFRVGERFYDFYKSRIKSIQFYLGKYGSPTGTLAVKVREIDGTEIGTLGSIDVSTIGTGAWYTFNTTPVTIDSRRDIRIQAEYSTGDSDNYIMIRINTESYTDGCLTYYDGTQTDATGADCTWQSLLYDVVNELAQTYVATHSGFVPKATLRLYKIGSPTSTITVALRDVDGNGLPTGPNLREYSFAASGLTASPGTITTYWFPESPSTYWWVNAGQKYAIVVTDSIVVPDTANCIGWRYNTSGYSAGKACKKNDDGDWFIISANYAFYFQSWINDSDAAANSVRGAYWEAQTFKAGVSGQLRRFLVKGYCTGNFDTLTYKLRATSGGLPVSSPDLSSDDFKFLDNFGVKNFVGIGIFVPSDIVDGDYTAYLLLDLATPVTVTSGTTYALILEINVTNPYWYWRYTTPSIYADGQRCYSINSGNNWTADSAKDYTFEIWYTTNDVDLLPAALTVGDYIAYGLDQPFRAALQDIGVVGAGTYTLAWEYSLGSGSWAACVDLIDGSGSFKNQWSRRIEHTPQGDWAQDTINSITRYWLRARVTAIGTGYVQPKGTFCLLERLLAS